MSSAACIPVEQPAWFWELLGRTPLAEGESDAIHGQEVVVQDGLPRVRRLTDAGQVQTADVFGYKWSRRETFDSPASRARAREWLIERYGDLARQQWLQDGAVVVDAGCGAGLSGLELLADRLPHLRYLGVDVSTAVDMARARFAERGVPGAFLQADLMDLPLPAGCADVVFSEGVLHHTPSTRDALAAVTRLLAPGGRILFYVYRRKGPVREFTDDLLRDRLHGLPPEAAWKALEPLTRLGIALGELHATVDLPEPIDLLGIPAGKIDVQRLFYWHVAKAFYRPDLSFDEMNHINYDWYHPTYAHRQSPDEVRSWCADLGLAVERERVEEAGITIVARRG